MKINLFRVDSLIKSSEKIKKILDPVLQAAPRRRIFGQGTKRKIMGRLCAKKGGIVIHYLFSNSKFYIVMEVTLETERLWLRPPRIEDAEALFTHYTQHPEVPKFLTWKTHTSIEDTRTFLENKVKDSMESGNLHFAIVPKDLNEAVGMIFCGMQEIRVHLGYVIGPAFWRRGYMSEAVKGLIKHFFTQKNIWRVEALCDVENIGSARVMEKAGMQREGLLRSYLLTPNHTPGPKDAYLYARVREE